MYGLYNGTQLIKVLDHAIFTTQNVDRIFVYGTLVVQSIECTRPSSILHSPVFIAVKMKWAMQLL